MSDQAQIPRVFVDFQNSDPQGRVRLNTVGTLQDLSRLGIVLREGAEVILYCHELEADGTVVYSAEERVWVGIIDWNKIRDLPANRC